MTEEWHDPNFCFFPWNAQLQRSIRDVKLGYCLAFGKDQIGGRKKEGGSFSGKPEE